jgi:2-hydroxychromene-2-carboxylate isomerase
MSEPDTRSDDSQQAGLASIQDSPEFARKIQRRVTKAVPVLLRAQQAAKERFRQIRGGRHVIDFFHQVDDAYSELALQAIAELRDHYDVDFRFHLVGQADRIYAPEPDMLADYGRRDCAMVAPYYGLEFPANAARPGADRVRRVESLLSPLCDDPRFVDVGTSAGKALWNHDLEALDKLTESVAAASDQDVQAKIEGGNALRSKRRHYSGGMFWYGGEWYWGVDRLHHLERRLIGYGATRDGKKEEIRFERPPLDTGSNPNDGRLTLEIYPSLRSPYTAMIFDRSIALAKDAGIPVEIRPVMPMVMRGVPAPGAKGIYIMLDALRESDHLGVPFGDMYDPIGRPVERGFSLWPFANERGRGAEFISSFLRAAFAEGRATGSDEGLRQVVEEAGLDWNEAKEVVDNEEWRPVLEANRQEMYDGLGAWGVPSYRLKSAEGSSADEPDVSVWGQDRLWLIAAEIRRRLAE